MADPHYSGASLVKRSKLDHTRIVGGGYTGHLSVDAVVAIRIGREWNLVKQGTLRTERADIPANLACVWSEPNAPDGTAGAQRKCRLAEVQEFRFAEP